MSRTGAYSMSRRTSQSRGSAFVMYVDCQVEAERAMRYRIVDVETGAEIRDCVAACDDEGWILVAQPAIWTTHQQPCRLEFRRIRIEETTTDMRLSRSAPVLRALEVGTGRIYMYGGFAT